MKKVAIVGVGLIGGSIGAAIKSRLPQTTVVGVGTNLEQLAHAQSQGLIDEFTGELAAALDSTDLVVVSTPVRSIVGFAMEILNLNDTCLVTDAGSTKKDICDLARERMAGLDDRLARFVPSHPMAGSEKSGAESADGDLFLDRLTVLTPLPENTNTNIEAVRNFWEALGARTIVETADNHDRAVAVISHLPHAIASALAACTDERHLPFASTGWLDTTRIAAGSPELWQQIFAQNQQPLLDAIAEFEEVLHRLKSAIRDENQSRLIEILNKGKSIRDSLGN